MKFRIRHITEYNYAGRVSNCYNLAHMIPRNTARQKCLRHFTHVSPNPSFTSKREDYFGNTAYHFEIQKPHKTLVISVESEVEVSPQKNVLKLDFGTSCAESLRLLHQSKDPDVLLAKEYILDSSMVPVNAALKDYAQPSFADDKPLLSAVSDLTSRIFNDFEYDPTSTNVATPVAKVMQQRSGVCQDFAHLQVGCLRAMGFPAKYVSGYIETLPPPGQEKLVGSDASHAWVSVFSPQEGWFEFDPTNNTVANEQHIITAWGRDYFDVTPLQGVIFGGGDNPVLNVSVDVARLK